MLLAKPQCVRSSSRRPRGSGNQFNPSGTITTRRPTFSYGFWSQATGYEIWIEKDGEVFHIPVQDENESTWTPCWDMPYGDYEWWVRPLDDCLGCEGGWSPGDTFTIQQP